MRDFEIIATDGAKVAWYLAFDDHLRFAHEKADPRAAAANARLIAAAPEMLDLLREIAPELQPWQDELLGNITSLITRIEGET